MSATSALDDLRGLGRRLSVAVKKAHIEGLPSPLDAFVQDRTNLLKNQFLELNSKLNEKQKELDALKKAHSRQEELLKSLMNPTLDHDDAVKITFDVGTHIICSRMHLCHWSPALKALLSHGNGLAGDFPADVHIRDIAPETFQAALDFRCSGHLRSDSLNEGNFEHPLLKFSDCYDLQDLRSEYLAAAEDKVPLSPKTARWHLNLAAMTNDSVRREKSWHALAADGSDFSILHKEFPQLSFDDAKVILEQDCLNLPFGEGSALTLFSRWVLEDSGRIEHSMQLLRSVRLSLLSVREILDFQHEVATHKEWNPAKDGILSALRSALEAKLSGGLERKRKHSLVDVGPEEQSNLKIMRAARSLFAQGSAAM